MELLKQGNSLFIEIRNLFELISLWKTFEHLCVIMGGLSKDFINLCIFFISLRKLYLELRVVFWDGIAFDLMKFKQFFDFLF